MSKACKKISMLKAKIVHLRQESDKLRKSVESLRDFQNKKGEIELHSQLLPYVKVKDHKEKLNIYKEEYERAKANLRAILKDKNRLQILRRLWRIRWKS